MIPDSDIGPQNSTMTLFSTTYYLLVSIFLFFKRIANILLILKIIAFYFLEGNVYSPVSFYFYVGSLLISFTFYIAFRVYVLLKIKKLEQYWDLCDIQVLSRTSDRKQFEPVKINKMKIGDIVLLKSNTTCPVDILVLDTADQRHSDKIAFVNECRITGRRFITEKKAIKNMNSINKRSKEPMEGLSKLLKRLRGKIEYDPPSVSIQHFTGKFNLKNDPKVYQIKQENVVFGGSRLHTSWIIGYVLYNGLNTKIIKKNFQDIKTYSSLSCTESRLEKIFNKTTAIFMCIFLFEVVMVFLSILIFNESTMQLNSKLYDLESP